jgi:hypothetical protein
LRECIQGERTAIRQAGCPGEFRIGKPSGRGPVPNSSFAGAGVLICQAQAASATLTLAALAVGGFHVGSDFASKVVWLVGGGSNCRHGTRAGRVRASRGTDCRYGASAITTARTAHGSANAAPRSSCRAGLPARRSSRGDVITFNLRGRRLSRPRHSCLIAHLRQTEQRHRLPYCTSMMREAEDAAVLGGVLSS